MLVAIDASAIAYLHGRVDAKNGEPLFEDAAPEYARGWCAFHKCGNPYRGDTPETLSRNGDAETEQESDMSNKVFLMKGGYYYRPGWCGYTAEKCTAGRYDRAEAERHVANTEGVTIKEID